MAVCTGEIYDTDGSSHANFGSGGWAVILLVECLIVQARVLYRHGYRNRIWI